MLSHSVAYEDYRVSDYERDTPYVEMGGLPVRNSDSIPLPSGHFKGTQPDAGFSFAGFGYTRFDTIGEEGNLLG